MKLLSYLAKNSAIALLSLLFSAFILAGCVYFYMYTQLPSVDELKTMRLQVPLRIYTSDGKLIAEFGEQRRAPVSLDQVPKPLIDAILATEDQRFFDHPGVDFFGLLRATKELLLTGRKVEGASTITMQVARNFYLTRKKTFSRKIREILLALKIDHTLSKDKILELYLNKIYLGQRAYGVAAAAEIYYGKKLDQLTLPEMAMIAGLPQAPSKENPISNPEAALARRNHVLERMHDLGYITDAQYQQAIHTPLTASYHGTRIQVYAPYVAEMARDAVVNQYGEEKAYGDGLKVYTTLDSRLQKDADFALQDGLLAYDRRHGYRGPVENLGNPNLANPSAWLLHLKGLPSTALIRPAAVLTVSQRSATALLASGQTITIPWSGLSWASRQVNDGKYRGAAPRQASDVVRPGDVIYVRLDSKKQWALEQMPQVEGALVSLNPNNGAILALVGGFSFQTSHFNRAIQALRQPGSNFKPFIYAAGLAKGLTLATIINDAPIVINDTGDPNNLWRPQNDNRQFYGPTRLKVGLVESRNIVSIRLLQQIGLPYALDYLRNFGFDPNSLPHSLSLALGTADVSPLQIATGYAVFANGGYLVTPYFIDHITDGTGKTIYQMQAPTVCDPCTTNPPPAPTPPRTVDADVAYLMTTAMQDVIRQGTGRGALVLKRSDLAGKTGTAQQQKDTWFSGFNRNLVTTVWVGFDQPRSLYEFGAQAALPIWTQFMGAALAGTPETSLAEPPGIVSVRIDPATGLLARPGQTDAIFEYFRQQNVPTATAPPPDNNSSVNSPNNTDDASQLF